MGDHPDGEMEKAVGSLTPRLSGEALSGDRVCKATSPEVVDEAMKVKRWPWRGRWSEKRMGPKSEY